MEPGIFFFKITPKAVLVHPELHKPFTINLSLIDRPKNLDCLELKKFHLGEHQDLNKQYENTYAFF